MSRQVKIFLAALLLMCGQRALADCATTNGTVTLPSSNSFAVYNGQISAQGTAGLNCTGLGLNLLTQNTVTVKIAPTTNNMALLNGNGSGDKISYLIYPDSNYQYTYSVGQTIDYSSLNLLSLILISANVNFPVYIKTVVGAVAPNAQRSRCSYFCGIAVAMIIPFGKMPKCRQDSTTYWRPSASVTSATARYASAVFTSFYRSSLCLQRYRAHTVNIIHSMATPGGNMRQDDFDADYTFSDLINIVALATLLLIAIAGGWYFS